VAKIDFDDEDAVLAAVAKDLKEDPEDLKIESNRGLESFGEGTVYTVKFRGSKSGHEYTVVEDDDQANALALAVVTQDLESEPEIFESSFIESHIDTTRLARDLHGDVRDMAEEELREMRPRDFWKTAERHIDVPEEDEDGEMPDPDDFIEDVAEKMAEERLKDPMQYLADIYGDTDAVAQAIKIAGIDVKAAAEDAVDTDGWQHFLAHYDGNSYETKSGLVYWREN